jgi:NADPH:quinone reductase-like Zn-dependent oxidoreductase
MSTHAAIIVPSQGERLQEQQVNTPTIEAGKVLVRVEYASPGPIDMWQAYHGLVVRSWPIILSSAFTGTVIAVAPDVDHVKEGDKILSYTFGPNQVKAAQEIVLQHANRLGKVPPNLDLMEVTTIPTNVVTAIHSISHTLKLPLVLEHTDKPLDISIKNKRILIWGGGTSSGQYVLQILALSGYSNIIVTASPKHHVYLRSLGATHTVDYRAPTWKEDVGEKVDYVLDCVGDVEESLRKIAAVVNIGPDTLVAALLPIRYGGNTVNKIAMDLEEGVLPKDVKFVAIRTHEYEENEYYKKYLQSRIIPELRVEK